MAAHIVPVAHLYKPRLFFKATGLGLKAALAKPASKRTTDFGVKKVQGDLF